MPGGPRFSPGRKVGFHVLPTCFPHGGRIYNSKTTKKDNWKTETNKTYKGRQVMPRVHLNS